MMMTPETNWSISSGSLASAVTFESFDSPPIDSSLPKPPLLLIPPHDFSPCQITLNFTQKHEIRQVYVRSTARVYEIYYAPGLQSDNEYLCTVRCNAAVSVEENSSPESDDWVEVKNLPVSLVDEGISDLPNHTSENIRNHKDYYEATAEINDSEPCMSLTIRLLSLQTKGCVYVDEVYVFADPIDTSDCEEQTVNAEASSSSLMTMLVPSLLGLTKSRSAQLHNRNSSDHVSQTEYKPATSVNLADQQDAMLLKQNWSKTELARSQLPVSTPDKDKVCDSKMENDFSSNCTVTLLEQLVSRVSRIEDICLRFEEKMLKPINNMESRLEQVEQQVEFLVKKSQCAVSRSCPTFELNYGNHPELCGESESEKTESFLNRSHKSHEDATDLESTFYSEKEEENDILKSPEKEQPKKSVSINDALAAALAGFSSFTKPDDSLTVVPLESLEEPCLKNNQVLVDTPVVSNADSEASISSESLKETEHDFTEEEHDDTTPTCDINREIPDYLFRLEGMPEVGDEEALGPITSPSHEDCETDTQLVKQDSIKASQVLPSDKIDILKYFRDQSPGSFDSTVDFESPILEVKFDSLENGSHGFHLEALFSNTDDPATVDDLLITPQWDEECSTAKNLLVDFDGDVVLEGVQQDHLRVLEETSFASLI
uniref:uncharacterized protein LOC122582660 n=1 Tax=Erigeron canadensis TaxID=72917 RepID=UPI001CB9B916|nr:uncharacterized protein LOC122582660 [Erigeron canadensis]